MREITQEDLDHYVELLNDATSTREIENVIKQIWEDAQNPDAPGEGEED